MIAASILDANSYMCLILSLCTLELRFKMCFKGNAKVHVKMKFMYIYLC